MTAILAAGMLAVGVGVGAAIGPAAGTSFAGDTPALVAKLLSELAARNNATPQASSQAPAETPAEAPLSTSPPASSASTTPAAAAETPASGSKSSEAEAEKPGKSSTPAKSKVPAVTNVWLIELSGPSYEELLAQKAAAPYISGQLIPTGTLLSGWSAIEGNAFASEAALAAPVERSVHAPDRALDRPAPVSRRGRRAKAARHPPERLKAADEFAQATLPKITGTAAFREHGLAVVTFATVGLASQQELPAGASSATLTSKPPGGVLLISPFAKAGARSSVSYQVAAPVHTVEQLLH